MIQREQRGCGQSIQVSVQAEYFLSEEGAGRMVPMGDWKWPQYDCDFDVRYIEEIVSCSFRLFRFREFRSLDQTGQILFMNIVHRDVFNDLRGIYE